MFSNKNKTKSYSRKQAEKKYKDLKRYYFSISIINDEDLLSLNIYDFLKLSNNSYEKKELIILENLFRNYNKTIEKEILSFISNNDFEFSIDACIILSLINIKFLIKYYKTCKNAVIDNITILEIINNSNLIFFKKFFKYYKIRPNEYLDEIFLLENINYLNSNQIKIIIEKYYNRRLNIKCNENLLKEFIIRCDKSILYYELRDDEYLNTDLVNLFISNHGFDKILKYYSFKLDEKLDLMTLNLNINKDNLVDLIIYYYNGLSQRESLDDKILNHFLKINFKNILEALIETNYFYTYENNSINEDIFLQVSNLEELNLTLNYYHIKINENISNETLKYLFSKGYFKYFDLYFYNRPDYKLSPSILNSLNFNKENLRSLVSYKIRRNEKLNNDFILLALNADLSTCLLLKDINCHIIKNIKINFNNNNLKFLISLEKDYTETEIKFTSKVYDELSFLNEFYILDNNKLLKLESFLLKFKKYNEEYFNLIEYLEY